MARNQATSFRSARLVILTLEESKNKKPTKKQLAVLTLVAQLQESGNDSGIDYSDIPKLSDEQLKQMVRQGPENRKTRD